MKYRIFSENNYFAIQDDDYNIFRYKIRDDRPITHLEYPDVVDVSLGSYCTGGCAYCYASATKKGDLYPNVVQKLDTWLGSMTANQRPFQIAIGGGGEPTLHPDLCDAIQVIAKHGVIPTYTTAGFSLITKSCDSDKEARSERNRILAFTKDLCGGVAVTAHSHMNWEDSVGVFLTNQIRTNIHVVVGKGGRDIEYAKYVRNEFPDAHTVVLLPFVPMGHGTKIGVNEEQIVAGLLLGQKPGYAIGAMYSKYANRWPCLYEAYSMFDETKFSAYLELTDHPVFYKSSFERTPR